MLSDLDILRELDNGNIVIEPFDRRNLSSNSYDVRLGNYIGVGDTNQRIIDVCSQADILGYWKFRKIKDVLTIFPGETILCHTQEFIGGKHDIATKMNARSSIMRTGISVCKCAGFGDVGYINRWTMEMTNHLNVAVALRPGMRVAQISFFRTGKVSKEYSGKYRDIGTWKPEDMLPRLWKDWEMNE